MRIQGIILAFAGSICAIVSNAADDTIEVVKDGKSNYAIIQNANATAS